MGDFVGNPPADGAGPGSPRPGAGPANDGGPPAEAFDGEPVDEAELLAFWRAIRVTTLRPTLLNNAIFSNPNPQNRQRNRLLPFVTPEVTSFGTRLGDATVFDLKTALGDLYDSLSSRFEWWNRAVRFRVAGKLTAVGRADRIFWTGLFFTPIDMTIGEGTISPTLAPKDSKLYNDFMDPTINKKDTLRATQNLTAMKCFLHFISTADVKDGGSKEGATERLLQKLYLNNENLRSFVAVDPIEFGQKATITLEGNITQKVNMLTLTANQMRLVKIAETIATDSVVRAGLKKVIDVLSMFHMYRLLAATDDIGAIAKRAVLAIGAPQENKKAEAFHLYNDTEDAKKEARQAVYLDDVQRALAALGATCVFRVPEIISRGSLMDVPKHVATNEFFSDIITNEAAVTHIDTTGEGYQLWPWVDKKGNPRAFDFRVVDNAAKLGILTLDDNVEFAIVNTKCTERGHTLKATTPDASPYYSATTTYEVEEAETATELTEGGKAKRQKKAPKLRVKISTLLEYRWSPPVDWQGQRFRDLSLFEDELFFPGVLMPKSTLKFFMRHNYPLLGGIVIPTMGVIKESDQEVSFILRENIGYHALAGCIPLFAVPTKELAGISSKEEELFLPKQGKFADNSPSALAAPDRTVIQKIQLNDPDANPETTIQEINDCNTENYIVYFYGPQVTQQDPIIIHDYEEEEWPGADQGPKQTKTPLLKRKRSYRTTRIEGLWKDVYIWTAMTSSGDYVGVFEENFGGKKALVCVFGYSTVVPVEPSEFPPNNEAPPDDGDSRDLGGYISDSGSDDSGEYGESQPEFNPWSSTRPDHFVPWSQMAGFAEPWSLPGGSVSSFITTVTPAWEDKLETFELRLQKKDPRLKSNPSEKANPSTKKEDTARYQTGIHARDLLMMEDAGAGVVLHFRVLSEQEEQRIQANAAYVARRPEELSFAKEEVLVLLDNSKKWWLARNSRGKKGIVPSNYFTILAYNSAAEKLLRENLPPGTEARDLFCADMADEDVSSHDFVENPERRVRQRGGAAWKERLRNRTEEDEKQQISARFPFNYYAQKALTMYGVTDGVALPVATTVRSGADSWFYLHQTKPVDPGPDASFSTAIPSPLASISRDRLYRRKTYAADPIEYVGTAIQLWWYATFWNSEQQKLRARFGDRLPADMSGASDNVVYPGGIDTNTELSFRAQWLAAVALRMSEAAAKWEAEKNPDLTQADTMAFMKALVFKTPCKAISAVQNQLFEPQVRPPRNFNTQLKPPDKFVGQVSYVLEAKAIDLEPEVQTRLDTYLAAIAKAADAAQAKLDPLAEPAAGPASDDDKTPESSLKDTFVELRKEYIGDMDEDTTREIEELETDLATEVSGDPTGAIKEIEELVYKHSVKLAFIARLERIAVKAERKVHNDLRERLEQSTTKEDRNAIERDLYRNVNGIRVDRAYVNWAWSQTSTSNIVVSDRDEEKFIETTTESYNNASEEKKKELKRQLNASAGRNDSNPLFKDKHAAKDLLLRAAQVDFTVAQYEYGESVKTGNPIPPPKLFSSMRSAFSVGEDGTIGELVVAKNAAEDETERTLSWKDVVTRRGTEMKSEVQSKLVEEMYKAAESRARETLKAQAVAEQAAYEADLTQAEADKAAQRYAVAAKKLKEALEQETQPIGSRWQNHLENLEDTAEDLKGAARIWDKKARKQRLVAIELATTGALKTAFLGKVLDKGSLEEAFTKLFKEVKLTALETMALFIIANEKKKEKPKVEIIIIGSEIASSTESLQKQRSNRYYKAFEAILKENGYMPTEKTVETDTNANAHDECSLAEHICLAYSKRRRKAKAMKEYARNLKYLWGDGANTTLQYASKQLKARKRKQWRLITKLSTVEGLEDTIVDTEDLPNV